jgi:iron(III) transport system substrate-binding protein
MRRDRRGIHPGSSPIAPLLPGLLAVLLLGGCAGEGPPLPPEESVPSPSGGQVMVYVEVPRHTAGPILSSFTQQHAVEVHAVYRETVGEPFDAMLHADAAAGKVDLFWGETPLSAMDLVQAGLAVPFRPVGTRPIPSQYRDPQFRWIGFAVNPRVIMFNTDRVRREEAPRSLQDLVRPPWGGRAAVARIARGTPAFHAAALYALWGAERAGSFFEQIRSAGNRIVEDDAAVRRDIVSGKAAWGFLDLDEAIGAQRDAEPVHSFFPDRLAIGAVATPQVAVLVRGAPHPLQAKGLFAFLFSVDSAYQLSGNDRPLVTLLPNVPKPDWVPNLGAINITVIDNAAVYAAYRTHRDAFRSWGASGAGPLAAVDARTLTPAPAR